MSYSVLRLGPLFECCWGLASAGPGRPRAVRAAPSGQALCFAGDGARAAGHSQSRSKKHDLNVNVKHNKHTDGCSSVEIQKRLTGGGDPALSYIV